MRHLGLSPVTSSAQQMAAWKNQILSLRLVASSRLKKKRYLCCNALICATAQWKRKKKNPHQIRKGYGTLICILLKQLVQRHISSSKNATGRLTIIHLPLHSPSHAYVLIPSVAFGQEKKWVTARLVHSHISPISSDLLSSRRWPSIYSAQNDGPKSESGQLRYYSE